MSTTLRVSGKSYDTQDVPDKYDLFYCAQCGCRISWYLPDFSDKPIAICEDCMCDIANGEVDEIL